MKKTAEKIIVALDYSNAKDAIAMAQTLANTGVKFKVGMELFYAEGRSILEKISSYGDIFLDLKLHDIPETMAKSAAVLTEMGVWMFNVHASAGEKALQTVNERVSEVAAVKNLKKPLLIAVTVLTSLSDLTHLGSTIDTKLLTLNLAKIALDSGFDGVVCSPQEVSVIKTLGAQFLCVTPGIRSPQDQAGDQVRTATPAQALQNGSDYLVIGRPITKAKDPLQSLDAILQSL